MQEYLVIRLYDDSSGASGEVTWLRVGPEGEHLDGGQTDLSGLGRYYEGLDFQPPIAVLAPACPVLLTTVELPASQLRYAKQALPFLVEEKLAEDVEDVHIALGPVRKGEPVPLAVVRHFDMICWLDALYSAGLPPAFMVSEALALPWTAGRVSVYVDNEMCLVRDGALHGVGVDHDNALLVLEALNRERGESDDGSPEIDLYTAAADVGTGQVLECVLAERYATQLRSYPQDGAGLLLLARQLASRDGPVGIDLLQGGYAVQRPDGDRAIDWHRVAIAFAACVVLYVVATAAGGLAFQWGAKQVRADTVAVYREWFPGARRVFDPRRQLLSHLNSGQRADSAAFLAQIAGLTDGWGSGEEELRLRSLSYAGASGQLTLELEGTTAAAFNGLQQRLSERGFEGQLSGVAGNGDRVAGRLQLAGVL